MSTENEIKNPLRRVDLLDGLAADVVSHPRLSRDKLMQILESCYRLGVEPLTDIERDTMLRRISHVRGSEGANRAYVEKSDTSYPLIARYVFAEKKERANSSRYSVVMSHLHKQGIKPDDFLPSVKEAGGLVDIYYKARQRSSCVSFRSKLTLSTTVGFAVGEKKALVLVLRANGFFDVVQP